jgi:hypothetical protein
MLFHTRTALGFVDARHSASMYSFRETDWRGGVSFVSAGIVRIVQVPAVGYWVMLA